MIAIVTPEEMRAVDAAAGEAPDVLIGRAGSAVARAAGPAVVEHGNVGFLGYYAGPAVHIIDRNGLTDPLLARLPVRDPADWRIGHFRRDVPAGYADTLRGGQNVIEDANLAAYFDVLARVPRGPLGSTERLREIWQLNRGAYAHLLPGGSP